MKTGTSMRWTASQQTIIGLGRSGKAFAEGPAGTGKTTAAVEHIAQVLKRKVSAQETMVVVAHPLLGRPYRVFDETQRETAGAELRVTTYAGLIRRAVELFWPVVAESTGHQAIRPTPVFLNFEAALVHMARIAEPLIEQRRLFETVRLPRRRIYAQILDDVNKSALVGFPVDEIAMRLQSAWTGSDMQARMYDDVQICASAFRAHCLDHGLLDYSLTVETFRRLVWPLDSCRTWLMQSARHLVYDNAEEDTPAAHDLMIDLIEAADSALVLFDSESSYRRLLGADETSARRLEEVCDTFITLDEPVLPADRSALIGEFAETFGYEAPAADPSDDPLRDVEVRNFRYFPQMMDDAASEIARLVEDEGVEPSDIAVVMPYLGDAPRFALVNRLARHGIAARSLRPSRPLGGEPAARAMLVLAQLAHPAWGVTVKAQDIAQALSITIADLDPVRAYLLASTYRPSTGLAEFADLSGALRRRITDDAGRRYETLRVWLAKYQNGSTRPLDHFLAHLYNDVLVHEGFRFHEALEAGNTAAALVRSANEYRKLAEDLDEPMDAAKYVQSVLDGQIGQQTLSGPDDTDVPGAVQIAPAYTFLMNNRAVAYQFWLDVGSTGWTDRMFEPLSQPYVLSRNWPVGKRWTADDDALLSAELAYRVVSGLLRRCTERAYLIHVEFNEQGFSQQGPLLLALQRIMRRQNAVAQES